MTEQHTLICLSILKISVTGRHLLYTYCLETLMNRLIKSELLTMEMFVNARKPSSVLSWKLETNHGGL